MCLLIHISMNCMTSVVLSTDVGKLIFLTTIFTHALGGMITNLFAGAHTIQNLADCYVKPSKVGLKIQKAQYADEGQVHVTESIEGFIDYYDIMEESLKLVTFDPCQVFNVDEVGIQFAEHSLHLVTGCECLNKNMIETSVHIVYLPWLMWFFHASPLLVPELGWWRAAKSSLWSIKFNVHSGYQE